MFRHFRGVTVMLLTACLMLPLVSHILSRVRKSSSLGYWPKPTSSFVAVSWPIMLDHGLGYYKCVSSLFKLIWFSGRDGSKKIN